MAGFSALSPHVSTVTQQQLLTNTQNLVSTQTVTSAGTQTMTVFSTTTNSRISLPAGYYQYCQYYNCYPNPAPPGYYNWGCYTTGAGPNIYQCSGYVYKDANGCIDLLVPIDDGYTTQAQLYFNLHNLPSSYPSVGSWVTVTGQMYQGPSTGPYGGACPGSYINVTSIA